MEHNNLPDELVAEIENAVKKVRVDYDMVNQVPKEDIFALLEKLCTVLYYPLDNRNINGIHTRRTITNGMEDFVYINTSNPIEKQIYSAAHELGHIWKVDKIVSEKIDIKPYDTEDIINRFAAELLMPKEIFKMVFAQKLHVLGYDGKNISITRDNLMRVIVYLMNEFMVPYKAIVLRLEELHFISEEVITYLDNLEEEHADFIHSFIKEGQYDRLGKTTKRKSMNNLVEMINYAEQLGIYSARKLNKIREIFEIEAEDISEIVEDLGSETFNITI